MLCRAMSPGCPGSSPPVEETWNDFNKLFNKNGLSINKLIIVFTRSSFLDLNKQNSHMKPLQLNKIIVLTD